MDGEGRAVKHSNVERVSPSEIGRILLHSPSHSDCLSSFRYEIIPDWPHVISDRDKRTVKKRTDREGLDHHREVARYHRDHRSKSGEGGRAIKINSSRKTRIRSTAITSP